MYNIFQLKQYDGLDQYKLERSIKKLYHANNTTFFNIMYTLFSDIKLEYKTFNNKKQLIKIFKTIKNIDVNGKIVKSMIRYNHKNYIQNIFFKECFIVDMYSLFIERNTKKNHFKQYIKDNSMYNINNFSNIELFCTYLTSRLVEEKITPHFPYFYGFAQTSLTKHTTNITDEYDKEIIDNIKMDPYNDIQFKIIHKQNEIYFETYNTPILLIATEQLDNDLLNYIHEKADNDDTIEDGEWLSYIFQIVAALTIIQKYFNLYHNDLHFSNIMFSYTEDKYLYYTYKNKYYKIPTYNKILKIIDWGRSSYNFNNYQGKNTAYNSLGPTFGQYIYNRINLNNQKPIPFNPSIDMALFASNLLMEELFPKNGYVYTYIKKMLTDSKGNTFYDDEFDFDFYIDSATHACKGIPYKQIEHKIFKEFTVNKRSFKKIQKQNNLKVYDLN
tara:strand:- start:738 stop:2066 length:1329 start_codon:yes stop_codon:yes gene_type:complete